MKLITGIVIFILAALPLFGDTNGMLQVLSNLKAGWENKNIVMLSNCFVKFSDNQRKLYQSIFTVVSNVSVNFNIEDTGTEGPFGYVRAILNKSLTYYVPGASVQTRTDSKDIIYIFFNKDGKWNIVGTIDPNPKKKKLKRISSFNDIDYINSRLTNLPANMITNLIKNYQDIDATNLLVGWQGETGAGRYDIVLQDSTGRNIWSFNGIIMTMVRIPVIVFNQLAGGQMYQLQVSAKTSSGAELSRQVIQLKVNK